MLPDIVYLLFLSFALLAGVLGALSDVRVMRIPNKYPLIVFVSFFAAYGIFMLGGTVPFAPFLSHIVAGLVVFVLTFFLFSAGLFGGGDAKLLSAYALWVGVGGVADLIVYMALFGALLAVAALLIRRFKPFKKGADESWIGQLQAGKSKIAYGLAIVPAVFLSFFVEGYFLFL